MNVGSKIEYMIERDVGMMVKGLKKDRVTSKTITKNEMSVGREGLRTVCCNRG